MAESKKCYKVLRQIEIREALEEGAVLNLSLASARKYMRSGNLRPKVVVPEWAVTSPSDEYTVIKPFSITKQVWDEGEVVYLSPEFAEKYVATGEIVEFDPFEKKKEIITEEKAEDAGGKLEEPPPGMKRYRANRDARIRKTVFEGDIVGLDHSSARKLFANDDIEMYVPPGQPIIQQYGELPKYVVKRNGVTVEVEIRKEEIINLDPANAEPYVWNGSIEPYGWSLSESEAATSEVASQIESLYDEITLPEPDAYPVQPLPPDLLEKIMTDRNIRTAVCGENPYTFFHIYFAHAVEYDTAAFHREMFYLIEQEELRKIFVVSFRGSGKSTIFTSALPLWSIMGKPRKKFVVIICDTLPQAKLQMDAIKQELEGNALLKNDLGPFEDDSPKWDAQTIVFKNFNARILVVSVDSKIRGIHHGKYRPDLIVCDDVESTGDLGTLVDLMDQKLLLEIRTFSQKFTNNPSEKFMLMILCSTAKLENDNKSENVKRGLRTRCEQGLRPSMAPTGYLNEKRKDKACEVIVDPQRAPIVRQMFEKIGNDGWSGRRLHHWLRHEAKFKTAAGKYLSVSNIYMILKKTFYYGIFEYPVGSGNWYTGQHNPIITKELYDLVQEKLVRSEINKSDKEFAFTRLISCGVCGSGVTACEKYKNQQNGNVHRYVYYRCTRSKNPDCKEGYIKEEEIIEQIIKIFDTLDVSELGVWHKFKDEIGRYNKLRRIALGKTREKAPELEGFDTKAYAVYLLTEGSITEKRELLSNLKSRLMLKGGIISLRPESE